MISALLLGFLYIFFPSMKVLVILVPFYSFLHIRGEMYFVHNGLLIGLRTAEAPRPCHQWYLLSL